jgi:hypothetical protein
MHGDATRLERTLWVGQENERRKGRKGRKLPATIRRIGFVNDINHVDERYRRRFAPPGLAETGGNWRKLPARTLLEKLSAVSLSHSRGQLWCETTTALPEIPEIPPRAIAEMKPCAVILPLPANRATTRRL